MSKDVPSAPIIPAPSMRMLPKPSDAVDGQEIDNYHHKRAFNLF